MTVDANLLAGIKIGVGLGVLLVLAVEAFACWIYFKVTK